MWYTLTAFALLDTVYWSLTTLMQFFSRPAGSSKKFLSMWESRTFFLSESFFQSKALLESYTENKIFLSKACKICKGDIYLLKCDTIQKFVWRETQKWRHIWTHHGAFSEFWPCHSRKLDLNQLQWSPEVLWGISWSYFWIWAFWDWREYMGLAESGVGSVQPWTVACAQTMPNWHTQRVSFCKATPILKPSLQSIYLLRFSRYVKIDRN